MFKKVVLLFVVMLFAVSVHAQFKAGIRAGYNLSGIYNVSGNGTNGSAVTGNPAPPEPDWGMISGFQVGAAFEIPLKHSLYLQPAAVFSRQGFKDEYASNGDIKRVFSLYYLQIPVNLQYKLDVGVVKVLFQAGPYVQYGLFGRQKYYKKDVSQDLADKYKKITMGSDSKDYLSPRIDYGVGAGVGVQFAQLQLMAGYNLGLGTTTFKMDAKSRKYDMDMKNSSFVITLTYLFGRDDVLAD